MYQFTPRFSPHVLPHIRQIVSLPAIARTIFTDDEKTFLEFFPAQLSFLTELRADLNKISNTEEMKGYIKTNLEQRYGCYCSSTSNFFYSEFRMMLLVIDEITKAQNYQQIVEKFNFLIEQWHKKLREFKTKGIKMEKEFILPWARLTYHPLLTELHDLKMLTLIKTNQPLFGLFNKLIIELTKRFPKPFFGEERTINLEQAQDVLRSIT